MEEIASAADVTARTFFRYFTSKEDLVLLGQDEENRQVAALLKARPSKQSELDFLLEATALVTDWSPEKLARARRSRRLIRQTPALRNRDRGIRLELEELIAKGLTPARASKAEALRIRVVVATYLAAAGTVMDAYLEGELRGEPSAQLKAVGKLLRDGFGSRRP